mgnify:CR=1 FL=1
MKNLDKYLTLLDGDVDGLLLTSRYSRHYGAEFDIAEGVAIVTKKGCRYFTDSRYIESAEKNLKGFEVLDVNREIGYIQRLNTAIADFGVTTLGYEEHYLTAEEYFHYAEKLNAKLGPFHKPLYAFRATKEDWELELMRKAQAITDRAFAEVITRIKPGMTELELQAELIYCMYKNGGTGLAFDPIVVSGPNTSLPHGVAGERVIQKGDFVTMDFGASYMGYCSDMTRTVPVNGKFTPRQRAVYESVLNMMTYAKKILRPGILKSEYERLVRVFAAGELVKLGLITPAQVAEKPSDPPIVRKYYMHGCSHFLGLDVHDVGEANPVVLPGMVFTVEPGIYIAEEGIGIRLENDVLIGETENIDLLGDVPLLPDDIERLMAR